MRKILNSSLVLLILTTSTFLILNDYVVGDIEFSSATEADFMESYSSSYENENGFTPVNDLNKGDVTGLQPVENVEHTALRNITDHALEAVAIYQSTQVLLHRKQADITDLMVRLRGTFR